MLIYACSNRTCAEKEGAVFRLQIPLEAVLDGKNMATFYCRRCGSELCVEQPPFGKL